MIHPRAGIHLQSSTGWDPGERWPPEQNQDSVWNEEGAMGMDVELATHSVYDTHLLGYKLPENTGYIFSYYCIPSM